MEYNTMPAQATQADPFVYSLSRIVSCIIRVSPYFILHITKMPYRRAIPAMHYSYKGTYSRYHLAGFDTLFNIVLDGYTEMCGQYVLPETGLFFFFTLELTKSLDETLDKALADSSYGGTLSITEVLADDFVKKNFDNFKNYLEINNAPAGEIITYLQRQFLEFFDKYINLSRQANRTYAFDDILQVTYIDNGIWLSSVADMIALFNQHTFNDDAKQDFYSFGLAGKFIDDIVDLKRDISEGRTNLLYALLKERHHSCEDLHAAITAGQRLTRNWWLKYYSSTYKEYVNYLNHHFNQIRSGKLRLACDIMMIPAVLGYDYDPAR